MVGISKELSSLKFALILTLFVLVFGANSAMINVGKFDCVSVEPGHVMTSVRQSRSVHDCAATCRSARCPLQPCCTGFCQSLTSSACYLNMTSESTEQPLPDSSLGFKCYVREVNYKTSVSWQDVPGALTTVSVGPAGVWGVTTAGNIVHRDGTYETSGSTIGTGWTQVADTDQGSLKRLDVGDDVVWGITVQDTLACRHGINKNAVTGTSWLTMPNKAKDIAVSAKGQLVAISEEGHFIYREGRDSVCSNRGNWIITSSTVTLSRISIGGAGIWAVDVGDWAFYRPGSFGDNGIVGAEWENVDGSWKTVSVGTSFVIGVNSENIWRRDGVNESTPRGSTSEYFPGSRVDVDTTEGAWYVWGTKEDGNVSLGTFY